MTGSRLHRFSGAALVALSLVALACVVTGYFLPPQPDEGAAAHIFQLAILGLVPVLVLFLATADWEQRSGTMRPLLVSGVALALAFAALWFLEHVR